MRTAPISRADTILAAALFLLALMARLTYLSGWAQSPYFNEPLLDEQYHHDWARRIVAGTPDDKPFFRAPLYPYFLAGIYRVFGDGPLGSRTAQALMGSFSAVLLFLLGRWLFGRTVGGAAAAIAALYPTLVFFDGELLMPVLLVFLDLLFALALVWAWNEPRPGRWAVAGFAGGLSAIARPNILLPMAALAVWTLWRWRGKERRGKALAALALFGAGAAIPIAPVAIRNLVVGGDWVMIASQGGIVMWAGNGADADGIIPRHPTLYSRFERYEDTFELYAKHEAEEATGREMRPSEVSRWWGRRTWSYMAANPGRTLGLLGKKAVSFWSRVEIRNNKNLEFALQYSPQFAGLHRVLNFALIGPFALLGLAWALAAGFAGRSSPPAPDRGHNRKRAPNLELKTEEAPAIDGIPAWHRRPARERNAERSTNHRRDACATPRSANSAFVPPPAGALAAFVLVYAASIILFFVCDRYRAPMHPFFILFGVWAAARLIAQARERNWRPFSAAAAGLCGAALLVNVDWFDLSPQPVAEDWWMVSVCWQKRGERDLARQALERAVEADRDHAGAWHNLGAMATQDGNVAEAERFFREALRADSRYATAWSSLGAALAARGDAEGARDAFERCLEIDPFHALAHMNLGELERREGNLEGAREHFTRAAELYPSHGGAWIGLARVAAAEGKAEEARRMAAEAIRVGGETARKAMEEDEVLRRIAR